MIPSPFLPGLFFQILTGASLMPNRDFYVISDKIFMLMLFFL